MRSSIGIHIPCLAVALAAMAGCAGGGGNVERAAVQWEPLDLSFQSDQQHPWWNFPATVVLKHVESGEELRLETYWSGGRQWRARFAAPQAGPWSYETISDDPSLDGHAGEVLVAAPSGEQVRANPNFRGQLRVSPNGRYFEYADGTPLYLLADTAWAANTSRLGLGENRDGPLYDYLADRKSKGFTAILMQMMHGFGDYPDDPTGHGNEGGRVFFDRDFERVNPAYFEAFDERWRAIWNQGFATADPFAWWDKTEHCVFGPEQAERISAYLAVRYGAFNSIWAVSGEYQYALRDCGWTDTDIGRLGETIQRHNPYRRPLSIHPSGNTNWPEGHGTQSSRAFAGSDWLDHHWLQTGQSEDRMHNIVSRTAENRALQPTRPVFCSEAFYEHINDPDGAYHARWQAWTALLSGCAGYGYGAQGVWQFYDPDHSEETGKQARDFAPWREALELEGSRQMRYVSDLIQAIEWWKLDPRSADVMVDGAAAPGPGPADYSSPQYAAIGDAAGLLYVPRGNGARIIALTGLSSARYEAIWLDPRTGVREPARTAEPSHGSWTVPERPLPAEDWILLLNAK